MAEINIIAKGNINSNFSLHWKPSNNFQQDVFRRTEGVYDFHLSRIMLVNLYKEHTYIHPYPVISNYSRLETRGRAYKVEFPYTNELLIEV